MSPLEPYMLGYVHDFRLKTQEEMVNMKIHCSFTKRRFDGRPLYRQSIPRTILCTVESKEEKVAHWKFHDFDRAERRSVRRFIICTVELT